MKSLQFKTKLYYLLLSVACGLVLVGFIGYINLSTMKKNVDTLYFGSLVPLGELNAINTAYHHELEASVYRWKEGHISNEELSTDITLGLEHVDQMWARYLAHYKDSSELAYIHYAQTQIDIIKRYFEEIRFLANDHTQNIKISTRRLANNTASIHNTISNLISYESSVAIYERSKLLSHHQNSIYQLGFLLGIIVIGVIGFAWRIFMQIELQQRQLVESSQALQYLNAKLEQASYTDSLTGIFNRRYFNLVYEREYKRAVRNGKSLTFMMIDIDYFKQYNDTYGHLMGDVALKNVAHILRTTLQRPGDFVFRLGGEEFGVLLSETDCPSARQMAEKLRFNTESLEIEHTGNKPKGILTISIGAICVIPTEQMNNEALLHTADLNLYTAKERGRNKVIFTTSL